MGRGQCWILPRFEDRDHSSVLPHLGKVMGAENRIEDLGQSGNRSLGKMHQCRFRDIFRSLSLADLETPDFYLNIVRVG